MKKIYFSVLALYAGILSAFSQGAAADSSAYKPRKLTISEVDFVSAYYTQNGDHSAVTGGIGTEKLTDISNTIDVQWLRYDSKERKHNLTVELGIDHYTSASSDKIDPSTISSPSYADTRIYPSATYIVQNTKGQTVGGSLSFSKEYDYQSLGVGLQWGKTSSDNNREFSARFQAYLDQWKVILPVELRPGGRKDEGYTPRKTYSLSLAYTQVISPRMQAVFLLDGVLQQGLLATDYQRVYFKDGTENFEHLPDTRYKLPIGARLHYFWGDRVIVRATYRFYTDNWGLQAHTGEVELPVKVSPFVSVAPFYRYYTQTAADYFAPYLAHAPAAQYFTSDYDLSAFNSQFFGTGFRWVPEKGVFGLQHWNMLELRYGHYQRSATLNSDIVSLNLRFR
ncbi:DUF3570 domain-containing protein [Flaviaesturariibacter terrae]